uniref:Glycosyl hydrolase family 13 catalytic domain-containing protein n=1 Tax=candidate division WOR-3 bacterium TaxID=2052148 RepID=A0A7C3UNS9_UNCW3
MIDISRFVDVDSVQVIKKDGIEVIPIIEGKITFVLNNDYGICRLRIFSNGESSDKDIFFIKKIREKIKFTFKGEGDVYIAGSFTNWNKVKMDKKDNYFEKEFEISEGRHQYKFVVNGKWIEDPENTLKTDDGYGGKNSVIEIKRKREKIIDISKNEYRFLKEPEKVFVLVNDTIIHDFEIKDKILRLKNFDKGFLRIISFYKDHSFGYFSREIPNNEIKGGMMYFAMIDRFYDGNKKNTRKVKDKEVYYLCNFMGGDIEGIIKKLREGYFDSLGITCLWISPVYKQPDIAFKDYLPPNRKFTGYHGYWPLDLWSVDERFGDMEKLKELVKESHKRNIKVFLDLVFNHIHKDSKLFKEKKEWFTPLYLLDGKMNIRLFDEYPFTTWFDEFLPSFDFSNKEVIDYLVDNAIFWFRETDADGARLDALKHIPHDFWIELRKRLRKEFPDKWIYLIGETISSREYISEWISPKEVDGQFDFPLYWILRDVLAGKKEASVLLEEIEKSYEFFDYGLWIPFFGNHDFSRISSYINGDITGDEKKIGFENPPKEVSSKTYKILRLAFALLYTQSGLPVIYYGDEIGLSGAGDPDNRRMMKFDNLNDNERKLLETIKELKEMRSKSEALRYGSFISIYSDKGCIIYLKKYYDEMFIIGINLQEEDKELELTSEYFHNIKIRIPSLNFIIKRI